MAAYCGNATDAARRVGFSAGHGRRLMALPRVRAAIAARQAAQAAELGKPAAAAAQAAINREDLQREWTRIMRDEGCKIMIRLKASELLARSLGMFTARPEPQTPQFQIVLEGMEPDDIR
ncbi:MAG TPA: hypothetical protein PKI11_16265 [Candidatus Hydrogenedentes bacterium]|nr:hypothetical protein [Candidatus Hydrogenedentota bacterium]